MVRPEDVGRKRRSFVRILYGPFRNKKSFGKILAQDIDIVLNSLVAGEGYLRYPRPFSAEFLVSVA